MDAPVTPEEEAAAEEAFERRMYGGLETSPVPDQPATVRQLRYLHAVAREAGYDGAALDNRSVQEFDVVAGALSRRDASTLIDLIKGETAMWGTKHELP